MCGCVHCQKQFTSKVKIDHDLIQLSRCWLAFVSAHNILMFLKGSATEAGKSEVESCGRNDLLRRQEAATVRGHVGKKRQYSEQRQKRCTNGLVGSTQLCFSLQFISVMNMPELNCVCILSACLSYYLTHTLQTNPVLNSSARTNDIYVN